MSEKLEKLICILSDNVWHNIDEMTRTLEIPQGKFQQLVKFLTEVDLVQYNAQTNQIKLNQEWKTLNLNPRETGPETQQQPEASAVGTLIVPPKKTLIIQCTRITNLTNNSLELQLRINKKLSEIAINEVK